MTNDVCVQYVQHTCRVYTPLSHGEHHNFHQQQLRPGAGWARTDQARGQRPWPVKQQGGGKLASTARRGMRGARPGPRGGDGDKVCLAVCQCEKTVVWG